jgi:inosine-uridine nucleoside N-ribohydrolase
MQRVYVVGGLIRDGGDEKGNVFTVPSNRYAEFNMFLDPLAAKTVLESSLNITLIPLTVQRKVASFEGVLGALKQRTQHTPESKLVHRLLLLLHQLQRKQKIYHHMVSDLYGKSALVTLICSIAEYSLCSKKYILF